jgi:hypothetical protein
MKLFSRSTRRLRARVFPSPLKTFSKCDVGGEEGNVST